jgi:hypothetical protein
VRGKSQEGAASIADTLEDTYVGQIAACINHLFSVWQSEEYLTIALVDGVLLNSAIKGDYDWRIVQQGIKRHFEEDYISSIHIITPQLENILRVWGGKVVSVKKMDSRRPGTVWGEKVLGDLLSDETLKTHLDPSFVKVMKRFLDTHPFNVRNDIAHGFIKFEQCNRAWSAMLIWLVLKVVSTPLPESQVNDH